MQYNQENAAMILQLVEDSLKKNDPAPRRLNKLWWLLQFSRARALTNGLRQTTGDKVQDGPFKGMILTDEALNIYQSPILLGSYEHELHPIMENVISADYDCILNIGCSVGYYAVGLARRMPRTVIDAFDIDPEACRKCAEMARVNGVEDRVHIAGQFYGDDFSKYADRKTLVMIDIEGAEKEMLDPVRYPALQKLDVIVELHDLLDPTLSKTVCDRFIPTHAVEMIRNHTLLPDISGIMPPDCYLDPFDHLLLGWEGREGPTPWGIYTKKS